MSEQQVREYFAGYDETGEPPLPDGYAAASAERGRRGVRRRRALAGAVTTGVAALAALAVAGGMTIAGDTTRRPAITAATVLHRAALAAEDQPVPRDDQFIYLKIKYLGDGEPTTVDQRWESVDGSRTSLDVASPGGRDLIAPHMEAWTYRDLAALPTDPDKLLAELASRSPARADKKDGLTVEEDVFFGMGNMLNLLGGVMPPDLGAAFYSAAAEIPGVTVDEDAVDAAGRHGIGVRMALGRYHSRQPQVEEWVFDPETYAFLGRGGYSLSDSGARQDVFNSAVLDTGVVDRIGQLPR